MYFMEIIKDVKIEKLDHFGRGIIRDKGIIFVDDTLPEDVVDIAITKDKKNLKEAKVLAYKKRSPLYRESLCPYHLHCGGCHFSELLYEKQLLYKKEKVQELIEHMLKENLVVKEIIPSREEYHYRNKITLHGKDKKIGLYDKKSNDLIPISHCLLVDKKIDELMNRVAVFFRDRDALVYDVMIRKTTLEEAMIVIHGRLDYEEFRKEFPDVKVIVINDQIVTRDSHIKEKLFDKEFYISNRSFFQVNRWTVLDLYQKIIDYVKDKHFNTCLDLYCGTGTIALLISDFVQKVVGVEVVAEAIADAEENKKLNGIFNVDFVLGKVEDHLNEFDDIDLIIVDPPREGLDKKTKNSLSDIRAKNIVYVSCDPVTLMRDLNDLKKLYDIDEMILFDMFPNTYHVETLCFLSLKKEI